MYQKTQQTRKEEENEENSSSATATLNPLYIFLLFLFLFDGRDWLPHPNPSDPTRFGSFQQ